MEEWKDVVGYEGLYRVSNFGRVKSLRRTATNGRRSVPERILKTHEVRDGYITVVLYKNKIPKRLSVHRLVATAFLQNKNNYPFVNHKDENKKNNHVENLEWCTREYNMNYGTVGKRISRKRFGTKRKYLDEQHKKFIMLKG